MKSLFPCLALAALPLAALAQTKPAAKPTAKPVAKPATTPASKPAAKPAPAPVAKPATAPRPAPAATPPPAPSRSAAKSKSTGNDPFEVGTNAVNLGIGLGNRYGYGVGFLGGSSSVSPALNLSYERGVAQLGPGVLSLGGFVGYQGASYDFGGGDKWKYTDVVVMVRGAWHYPVTPEFDAYGGVGLGLRYSGVSYTYNSYYGYSPSSYSELASGLFVGGRYYFSQSIGAFAEVGYDQTFLKVGISAKF